MSIAIYRDEQEERVFIRRKAGAWARSGLITEAQAAIIRERTDPGLNQINVFFRILFFLFTCTGAQAAVGLCLWLIGPANEAAVAWASIAFGAASYGIAEHLARRRSLYRHGIEEALALGGVALACFGTGTLMHLQGVNPQALLAAVALLLSAGSLWLYLRFGFLYAAALSVVALCAVPFQLSLPPAAERAILAATLVLILSASARMEGRETPDFRRERAAAIQAFLLAALYLALNLRLEALGRAWSGSPGAAHDAHGGFPPLFYWATYGLVFLVPALGLYAGVRARKRPVIDVSLAAAVVTLATNKDYLGLRHNAWDPAILGLAMAAAALAVTRWLDRGDGGTRDGFTARSLLKPDDIGIGIEDVGAAVIPGAVGTPQPAPQADRPFEGGQSGGGGASRGA